MPCDYIECILIPAKKEQLRNIGRPMLTCGELLHWLGMALIVSTYEGDEHKDFWTECHDDV